jgi:formyltetrahydrofolate deformylase
MNTFVALLHGPDQPGLVARVSGWIFERGGNILHADQHRDEEAGIFFQRVEWTPDPVSERITSQAFLQFATDLGMSVRLAVPMQQLKVALFVSKATHCFHDLALRWKAGEYPGQLVAVISNHRDLEEVSLGYGLPFYHIPVTAETKQQAEQRQLELLQQADADLAILARYMQVLSPEFLERVEIPVINIHHSFLPAFAGGRPYHQAHQRGVKLIGATAHYATAILDDGPIIHQDVVRVTHRHGVEELVRKGRDLEKLVLAHAVRLHLEHRVLVYNHKTVVFD